MPPRALLRTEGLIVFAAATGWYFVRGGSVPLFVLLFLAPDAAFAGYLAGTRAGSYAYNAAHTYVVPGGLLVGAVWLARPLAASIALIWLAHIGADRLLGLGLRYPDGAAGRTHLQRC